MKHIYLSVFTIMAAGLSFGQVKKHSAHENPESLKPYSGAIPKYPKPSGAKLKTVIFSEDFNGSLGQMTTSGMNDTLWTFDLDGPNGQFSDPVSQIIASTSVANGFAMFDTDLSNPDLAAVQNRSGQLVSPVIDMTNFPMAVLNFEHAFRSCCSNNWIPMVEFSTDGFATFVSFDVSSGVAVNDVSGTIPASINITGFLDTVANLNNFQFRFNWPGDLVDGSSHYYWQIDDVNLSTPPDNDLALVDVYWGLPGVWGTVPYAKIPTGQLAPLEFGGVVSNEGGLAQNAIFSVAGTGGFTAASSSVNLGILANDFLMASPNFNAPGVGAYNFDFSVGNATADANPLNNTMSGTTEVTEYIYALDNGVVNYGQGNGGNAFEVGNIYNITNNQTLYGADFRISTVTSQFSSYYIKVCEVDTSKALEEMFTEIYVENGLSAMVLGSVITVPFTTPVNLTGNKAYALFLGSAGDGGATAGFAYTAGFSSSPFPNTVFIDYTDTTFYVSSDPAMLRMNFTPPPVITSTDADNMLCSPESLVLTSSSATGNVWSNGATTRSIVVSTAGSYSVVVGGMTSNIIDVIVNTADQLTSANGTNPTACLGNDGKIDVSFAGAGNGTIIWTGTNSGSMSGVTSNATITGLTAGGYTVKYDNGTGCLSSPMSVSLNDPGAVVPVITASGPLSFCAGGSVTLNSSATGGNIWSTAEITDNITVSTSGSYYAVNTTTPGCIGTSNVIEVMVYDLPAVDGGADMSICTGQSVNLSAISTASIAWDNGVVDGTSFVPTATTTYTVTATDGNSCVNTDQVTITVNPIPTVSITPVSQVCVYDAAVTLTATPVGGVFSGSGVTGAAFSPTGLNTGNYVVTYNVTENGCSGSASITIAVDSCLAVNDLNMINLNVFPNPVQAGELRIQGDQLNLFNNVMVMDQLGRPVMQSIQLNNEKEVVLKLNSLSAGSYFVKLSGKAGEAVYRIEKLD